MGQAMSGLHEFANNSQRFDWLNLHCLLLEARGLEGGLAQYQLFSLHEGIYGTPGRISAFK